MQSMLTGSCEQMETAAERAFVLYLRAIGEHA